MARHFQRPRRANSCGNQSDRKQQLKKWAAVRAAKELESRTGARVVAYRCKFECYLSDGSKAWHYGKR